MKNKKNKGGITCLSIGMILLSLLLFSVSKAANVEVQPGFYDQYKGYLKELPPPTIFNGLPSGDPKPVIASYQMPFSVLKIDFKEDTKNSYQPGGKVNIPANLSYVNKGESNVQKIKNACLQVLKDENKCKMPEVLKIPDFDNLGVLVQVWKKDPNKEGAKKGDYLVDEFYSLENVTLNDGENKNFTISWTIPKGQAGGNYYLSLYVNKNKNFDLVGTPLSVYSEAKRYDFEIKNENNGGLELDKNNIKINGVDYAYRKPAPTIKGSEINVVIPLNNIGDSWEQTAVKYELYRWGRIDPANLINTSTENKSLAAKGKDALNYKFASDSTESVYDLKITANTENSESAAYIRFAIDGQNRGIFRFLSFASSSGKLRPMFCVRNANWGGIFPGKVKLTLDGQVWEKEGNIPTGESNCFQVNNDKMVVAADKCVQLKGEIIDQKGKVVDTKTISASCKAPSQGQNTSSSNNIGDRSRLWMLMLGILVLIAAAIGFTLYLNNKNSKLKP